MDIGGIEKLKVNGVNCNRTNLITCVVTSKKEGSFQMYRCGSAVAPSRCDWGLGCYKVSTRTLLMLYYDMNALRCHNTASVEFSEKPRDLLNHLVTYSPNHGH